MALFSVNNVLINGLAVAVPAQTVSTLNYNGFSEKEKELFIKTTGIEKRRIAPPGMKTSDLCAESARRLLKALDWNPQDIDVLIFVSQSPDYIVPATSIILQDKLGLSKNCMAFDMNMGCSGYVYGLSVISSLLSGMPGKKALLLVGDVSSFYTQENDRSVYPIFSDAGSATALSWSARESMTFNMQSDGSRFDAIMIPEGGMVNPFSERSLVMETIDRGSSRNGLNLRLNGIEIFNFSVTEVPENIMELLVQSGKSASDIDYYLLHQANQIINDTVRLKLKLGPEKFPLSLKDFGNTSSATIPLTLITQLRESLQSKELNLVLSGFGVGLSWGSALLKSRQWVCLPLIEI